MQDLHFTVNNNGQNVEKPLGFDIEIYGDEGYHYKGSITSYQGTIPNFMIPIKGDKKLFINIKLLFVILLLLVLLLNF